MKKALLTLFVLFAPIAAMAQGRGHAQGNRGSQGFSQRGGGGGYRGGGPGI